MINTKGNTLINLENKISLFLIPESIIFTVKEWKKNKKNILEKIKKKFKKKKLIIRSSTTSEDTSTKSEAGAFESILNINFNDAQQITKSLKKIIKSYKKKINHISDQQILVQEMIQNIKMSGVIFTGDNFKNQNYYTINYDDVTGRSDTVTSGSTAYSNKTLYIYKSKETVLRSSRFKKLIRATREIENIFQFPLDIEFCVDKKNILYLLQVRPIVQNKSKNYIKNNLIEREIKNLSTSLEKSFQKKYKNDLFGDTTYFSQMSDWNPAEMIGQFPSRLSYSLYSNLITKSNWLVARKIMGYRSFKENSLMSIFAGRPYIDIRKSLNSLLPAGISSKLGNELINNSLYKLRFYPSLHDKIEFKLFPTGFSFQIKDMMKSLKIKTDFKAFEGKLVQMFNKNLKVSSKGSIEYNLNKIEVLKKYQQKNYYNNKFSINDIRKILFETKKYGIIPFSILARHGFIARDILNSLEKKKILNLNDIENFSKSFFTITSNFLNDQVHLKNKKISFEEFLSKYGHLRAGTYDIKSKNYSKINSSFFLDGVNNNLIKLKKFKLSKDKKILIAKLLKKKKINLKVSDLFDYIKNATIYREYAKFIFTRSINVILNKIQNFTTQNKIKLKDIENLSLSDLLSKKNFSKKIIFKKILESEKNTIVNRQLKLPEIVVEKENAFVGASVVSVPNFVTNKDITSEIKHLNNVKLKNIEGKIVLLENADPGYDYIFSYKIKGLVTKYGGANSHMRIRCNELNIPAAIGCGDALFEKLKHANKINLNCKNLFIKIF